jgi:RNA polymerase sigma-70 factor (ECF subfamily)
MTGQRNKETDGRHGKLTDADALRRLAQGEVSALAPLYDRYHQSLYRFISHATGHASDVEDIVHSTFMTAATAAASFDGRQSCRPWLLGIAAKLLYRRRRTLARLRRALREFSIQRNGEYLDPHRDLIARAELGALSKALSRLSHPKRVTLLLSEVEELTAEEIAAALRVPVGTVWTRLHHARRELRRELGQGGGS